MTTMETPLAVSLFCCGNEFRFDDVLNVLIYGRDQIGSRHSRLLDALKLRPRASVMIITRPESPRTAELYRYSSPPQSFFIDIDITENVRGEFPIRIKTPVFLLKINSRDLCTPNRSGFIAPINFRLTQTNLPSLSNLSTNSFAETPMIGDKAL